MLSVALAGLCGLVWGVGDFAGGKAAQRAASLPVTLTSKLIGLPLLATYALVLAAPPQAAAIGWGALAGVAGLAGLGAMSAGAMAVVAPVAAVTSAAVPVVVGLPDDPPRTAPAVAAGPGAGLDRRGRPVRHDREHVVPGGDGGRAT